MPTPLPFIAPPAAAPPPAPPGRTRSDLMAYLLEQSKPDDMVANPPQSFGEGLARTAGMGLDTLMAKRVIGQQKTDQQQKLNDFADLLEGINPELAAAARKGVGLDVANQVLSAHYTPKGPPEAPTIHEVYDPKSGRKSFAQWIPGAPDVGFGAGWQPLGGVETDVMSPEAAQQKVDIAKAGASNVTVDTRSENAEAAALGGKVVEHFAKIAEDLPAADQLLQSSQRMSEMLATTDTGTEAALVDFVRRNTGVELGENAGKIQALQAMVQYMTPRMRVPGSGATSDMEMSAFQAAIPGLMGTPDGNAIVSQTIGGLAKRRVDMASIAQDYLARTITAEQAVQRMRSLPDPFVQFKTWQESTGNLPKGSTGTAPEPAAAPAGPPAPGAIEDGYRFKGGDPADPANWEKV